MKPLSNTSISAIFAAGVTVLVGLSLQVPYFLDKETQTTNEMMLLRYELHQKFSPLKTDSNLVVVAIDQKSLDIIGKWPFRRDIHGDFLTLLAPEKPREVGWDIFFTEQEDSRTAVQELSPAAAPSPAPAADVAPAATSPTQPVPNSAPTPPVPEAQPAVTAPTSPATESPSAAPAAPPAADTNSAPSTPPPAPAIGSPSTSTFSLSHFRIGAEPESTSANPAPVAPGTPVAPPVTPAPDVSASAPPPTTISPAASPTQPPAEPPPPITPTASDSGPSSTAATNPPADALPLTPSDQALVEGAALFPNMVMAAEQTSEQEPPLTDKSMLPTRALKHVSGDITKLFTTPFALLPFPALRKETYFGFADQKGSSDAGTRTNDQIVVNVAGKILPAFDLQVLMQFWGVDPDQVIVDLGHEVTLPRPDGKLVHIPIDEKGQIVINYRARLQDFQVMSYAQMLKGMLDKMNGQKSEFTDHLISVKDKAVVIGVTFSGTDAGPTPLDNPAPLVVTHLNAINNILQQDYATQVTPWVWMPLYALLLFGAGNLMLRVGIAPMIPMGLLAMLILAGTGFAAMSLGNYFVPVTMPEVGILLLAGAVPTKRFFGEEREKLRVKSAMRAHLSDKVMKNILANPEGTKLGGTKQIITVMFCDIRGFTAYCDNRDPHEVLNVVNDYFEEMTKVVFKYDGTVDKYIGDCIMAFWNAPDAQEDHAQRAVCCAMEMRYALANFKVKRAGLDTELFECGIGIHTGEALVGNMGSSLKISYTAMGSTVNLGARLESLTKKLNERILISQATLDQLTGDFPITDRGEALVPGFANPIHVYGVGAEQDLGSAIQVGLKLAKKQDYTAEEVTKPIWAPAPLPEDADPNP